MLTSTFKKKNGICMFPTANISFVCVLNSRLKPLVQLVHSLKSRMESPDYEMVGHCVKE